MAQAAAAAVKERERAGWGKRADTYDLLTGRFTDRLAEPLLDAAGVGAGTRVLDVGTGPGYAARRAAKRGAVATGVDIADEMVALARSRSGGIRFLRADAEELPCAEGSFDAVVGNLVINHLPQPERAAREFARVLAKEGTIALSAWDIPERNRFLGILQDAVRASGVVGGPDLPAGAGPTRFADEREFRVLLSGAGFGGVEISTVSLTHRVANVDELWRGMLGGSVRTGSLVMAEPPRTRARIRAAVERLSERYSAEGGLLIPGRAKIARGKKS